MVPCRQHWNTLIIKNERHSVGRGVWALLAFHVSGDIYISNDMSSMQLKGAT
jgi:hypothetical protein